MLTRSPFCTPRALSALASCDTSCEEIRVGDGAGVAGLALPVVRDLVAATGVDVAVEAVVRRVELAAEEPLGERADPTRARCATARTSRAARGLLRPERLGVGRRPRRRCRVDEMRAWATNVGRRRERAALGQQRLDRVRLLRHHRPPCPTGRASEVTLRGFSPSLASARSVSGRREPVGAEAGGIGERGALRDPAAVTDGLEVADVGAGVPLAARVGDEVVEPEPAQPLGLGRSRARAGTRPRWPRAPGTRAARRR